MAITAKKLSELVGVSTRTLRWYDKVGLLKPAYYGPDNGYRYYEDKQVRELSKILFYKEFDLKLNEIIELLKKDEKEQILFLKKHLNKLDRKAIREKSMANLLKLTIHYLESEESESTSDLFNEFKKWVVGKDETHYALENFDENLNLSESEKIVFSNLKTNANKNWSKEDFDKHEAKAEEIYRKIVDLINKGHGPDNVEVQKVVGEHYKYAENFHKLDSKVYSALGILYKEKPEFKIQLEKFHELLPEFLSEAIHCYSGTI